MRIPGAVPRNDQIDYLHAQIREMRQLADAAGLKLEAYFLDMAYVELGDRIRSERIYAAPDNENTDSLRPAAAE